MTVSTAGPALLARPSPGTAAGEDPGGLTGTVLDVVESLGALGVGLLTVAETVFPPLPSELVLPLAGYLAERGRMSLLAVLVAATAGAVAGSWVLFGAARRLGRERSAVLLARLPLVDREDVDGAVAWFDRHGPWAVLGGRLVPGVRSLVSLPAGASSMSFGRFTLLTAVGSLLWNAVLVGAGFALGTQWRTVERYSGVVDTVVYAGVAAAVAFFVARRLRRRGRRPVAGAARRGRGPRRADAAGPGDR